MSFIRGERGWIYFQVVDASGQPVTLAGTEVFTGYVSKDGSDPTELAGTFDFGACVEQGGLAYRATITELDGDVCRFNFRYTGQGTNLIPGVTITPQRSDISANVVALVNAGIAYQLSPIACTVASGEVTESSFIVYQDCAFKPPSGGAFVFTIVDNDGNAVNLSGKAISFFAHPLDDTSTVSWSYTTAGGNITIGGTGNNEICVSGDDTHTDTCGTFSYSLKNTTDNTPLQVGTFEVLPFGDTPSE